MDRLVLMDAGKNMGWPMGVAKENTAKKNTATFIFKIGCAISVVAI